MLGWILSGMESPLETVSPQLLDSPLRVHSEYPHGALHCSGELLQVFIHPETPQDCCCCLRLCLQPLGRDVLVLGKVKFLTMFMFPVCKLQAGWMQVMCFHWSWHSSPLLLQYCAFPGKGGGVKSSVSLGQC